MRGTEKRSSGLSDAFFCRSFYVFPPERSHPMGRARKFRIPPKGFFGFRLGSAMYKRDSAEGTGRRSKMVVVGGEI